MESLQDGVKKIMLAGIGALATTAEESSKMIDKLVKKGEITVDQGKVLNEELKHNVKESVHKTFDKDEDKKTDLDQLIADMTPEQIKALKKKLDAAGTEEAGSADSDVTDDTEA